MEAAWEDRSRPLIPLSLLLCYKNEVLSLLTPGAPAFTSTSRQQEGGVEGRAEGHMVSCYGGWKFSLRSVSQVSGLGLVLKGRRRGHWRGTSDLDSCWVAGLGNLPRASLLSLPLRDVWPGRELCLPHIGVPLIGLILGYVLMKQSAILVFRGPHFPD